MNADIPQMPPPPESFLVQPARVGVSADIVAIESLFMSLTSEAMRDALLLEAGSSPESHRAFETKHGLPTGAVELVLLTADKTFADKTRNAGQKLLASKRTKEDIDEYVFESLALIDTMSKAYPNAYALLAKYTDDRNQQFVIAMRESFERNRNRAQYEIAEAVLPVNALAVVNVGLLVNLAVSTNVGGAVKVAVQVLAVTNTAVSVTTDVTTGGGEPA
jgi:hypothetical protein